MPNPFKDRTLRIDVFDLLQPHDLGFIEDLHGIVRQLTIHFCCFLRCRSIWVSRLLQFWEYWMIGKRSIIGAQSDKQYTTKGSRPFPQSNMSDPVARITSDTHPASPRSPNPSTTPVQHSSLFSKQTPPSYPHDSCSPQYWQSPLT